MNYPTSRPARETSSSPAVASPHQTAITVGDRHQATCGNGRIPPRESRHGVAPASGQAHLIRRVIESKPLVTDVHLPPMAIPAIRYGEPVRHACRTFFALATERDMMTSG